MWHKLGSVITTTVWGFCATFPQSAAAQEEDRFVESNLIAIFYHELGHAVIDVMSLPVLGQEEDAADVASILLIDQLYEEAAAVEIAYDTAFGFLGEADAVGDEPAWWDVHGPDLQRYYTLTCLFVGADLEARSDIAEELELPDARLDTCEEEFELANDSWGPVFDDLAASAPGQTLVYSGGTGSLTERVIAAEVEALNKDFALPQDLLVRVEDCGEANAFYDPETVEIIICSEFEGWLREMAADL